MKKKEMGICQETLAKRKPEGLIDLDGDNVITIEDETLFDSDDFDSDGDGMSNFMERAFGGDSLSSDSKKIFQGQLIREMESKELLFNDTVQNIIRRVLNILWRLVLICELGPQLVLPKLT